MGIVPNTYSLYHMFLQNKSLSFDGRDHLIYYSKKFLNKYPDDDLIPSVEYELKGLEEHQLQIDSLNNTLKN